MWCQFPVGFTQAIAGRNYYLPLVGIVYALSYTIHILPYHDLYWGAFIALFTYYATKMWNYMPAYRNLEEFYRYALFEFPDQFRARSHVIQKEIQERKMFWALRNAGVGLKHNPKDCTLNILMAQSLMSIGAWAKAKEYLGKAHKNMIPGQERYFLKLIDQFNGIIDDQIKNPRPIKQIKPDEVVEIKASQIAGVN